MIPQDDIGWYEESENRRLADDMSFEPKSDFDAAMQRSPVDRRSMIVDEIPPERKFKFGNTTITVYPSSVEDWVHVDTVEIARDRYQHETYATLTPVEAIDLANALLSAARDSKRKVKPL